MSQAAAPHGVGKPSRGGPAMRGRVMQGLLIAAACVAPLLVLLPIGATWPKRRRKASSPVARACAAARGRVARQQCRADRIDHGMLRDPRRRRRVADRTNRPARAPLFRSTRCMPARRAAFRDELCLALDEPAFRGVRWGVAGRRHVLLSAGLSSGLRPRCAAWTRHSRKARARSACRPSPVFAAWCYRSCARR